MNWEQFHSWTSTEVPLEKINIFFKSKMNREFYEQRYVRLSIMEQRNKH